MLWLLLSFILALLLAYFNRGLYIYLLYTLLYEVIIFAALKVSPKKRCGIVAASLLGYLCGTLLFYSGIYWNDPPQKNSIGKKTDVLLNKIKHGASFY